MNWTNGGGTYIPWTTTGTATAGTYVMPMTFYGGGGGSAPAARPQTPLEWLDGEIERTCAIARAA